MVQDLIGCSYVCILVEGIKPIPYANSDSQVVMSHVRKLRSMNSLLSDNWNNDNFHHPKKYEDFISIAIQP